MIINKKIAISESGFIFNSSTGDSFTLNPIAVEIIEMIKNGLDLNEIRKNLLKEYDVQESVLEKSIDEFVLSMKEYKIIFDQE